MTDAAELKPLTCACVLEDRGAADESVAGVAEPRTGAAEPDPVPCTCALEDRRAACVREGRRAADQSVIGAAKPAGESVTHMLEGRRAADESVTGVAEPATGAAKPVMYVLEERRAADRSVPRAVGFPSWGGRHGLLDVCVSPDSHALLFHPSPARPLQVVVFD